MRKRCGLCMVLLIGCLSIPGPAFPAQTTIQSGDSAGYSQAREGGPPFTPPPSTDRGGTLGVHFFENRPVDYRILFLLASYGLIIAVPFAIWIYALIDCLTKEPSENPDKLAWVMVVLFAHFIGALIYHYVRRPKRIEEYGR